MSKNTGRQLHEIIKEIVVLFQTPKTQSEIIKVANIDYYRAKIILKLLIKEGIIENHPVDIKLSNGLYEITDYGRNLLNQKQD